MLSTAAYNISLFLRRGVPCPQLISSPRALSCLRRYSQSAILLSQQPEASPPLDPLLPPQQDPTWKTIFQSYPQFQDGGAGSRQSPHEAWAMNHDSIPRPPPANAYSGRTVYVGKDGFGEAYRRLEIILNRNRVRATVRMTERHEKKGVKRRRLSSERWRKQFANEVRKKVQLVKDIRNRGA